ncbi:hypothetical protein RHGRI_005516 [Rhododendron griersonianum]|uniref:Uncharacterized protein n=1 Tax=Rhododendron griersonianum TaxID=479676 RepID=A0AAV6LEI3_9ERIC|nr:hypothetical protein RHGRI_005516 [Rhododendron griersonianum]
MLYGMQPYGIQLQSMLKEGQKDLYGLNEAVLKNIDSCKQLSNITRTSLSPNAKILVLAGKAQQEDIGDGANLTVLKRWMYVPKTLQTLIWTTSGFAKLLGGGLHNCTIVRGMILKTHAVGSIKQVEKAKVAVCAGGVDASAVETKGTVLIHSAEQLENYSETEKAKLEELINAVAESGDEVIIVSGGAVGEMALHFSGFVALLNLGRPSPEDVGYVESVSMEELVVLGSLLAVDDGVNTFEAMCRDCRIRIGPVAIAKFVAENAGLNAMEIISSLDVEHASGNAKVGIDLEEVVCKDVSTVNMRDLHVTKLMLLAPCYG